MKYHIPRHQRHFRCFRSLSTDRNIPVSSRAVFDLPQGDNATCEKPVILLYPSTPLDATVAIELNPLWSFSALYPRPPLNTLRPGDQDSEVGLLDVSCHRIPKYRKQP